MAKHRNAWSMDIYGCGCVFVVALAPYRPWFPSYNGFADFKTKIKGYGPEKVEGFPDHIRLATYADASVFLHTSGSMVNPVLLDCRNPSSIFAEDAQCMEYENDLMNSEESTKPFFMNTLTTVPFANWFHDRRNANQSQKENGKDSGKSVVKKPNLSHLSKKVLFRTGSIIDGIPYEIKS